MDTGRAREMWPSGMTDRERFNNQMHYRPVDRCFNMEFGYWEENFSEWSIFTENGIKDNPSADIFFNFDRILSTGAPWIHPPYTGQVVEETADKRVIMNADGVLAEVSRGSRSSIPHFVKPTVVTPEDWKKCREERFRRDDPARTQDIEELKKLYPEDRTFPLGVNCGSMIGKVRDMLTFEGIAYACYDYPDMVEDMVETSCLLIEDFLDAVLGRISFDFASGWEDIAFKSGPIVSLDFFKSVVVPRYRRISRKLAGAGIDIWYTDCDGDIRQLIPVFLEAGINTMFPFEVNCSGHPGDVLDKYGKDLRIMGGMDKMALGAGREAIKNYLESIAPFVARGGFIPFCDHRCPPNVKEEDYIYYLELKRELFGKGPL